MYVCMCMYVCIYIYIYICIHTYVYIYIYIYICICKHVCIVCVYIYIYIYVYTHMQLLQHPRRYRMGVLARRRSHRTCRTLSPRGTRIEHTRAPPSLAVCARIETRTLSGKDKGGPSKGGFLTDIMFS